jgi:molybdate transport system substrate-binding protein
VKRPILNLLIAATAGILSAVPAHAAQLTVFAAASLSDALKEIGAAYQKQTGMKVAFNFGASNV